MFLGDKLLVSGSLSKFRTVPKQLFVFTVTTPSVVHACCNGASESVQSNEGRVWVAKIYASCRPGIGSAKQDKSMIAGSGLAPRLGP